MNWEIAILLTSIMLFAYWLNYIMGSPLATKPDDIDERAILFSFPLWLGKARLKYNQYCDLERKYLEELGMTNDPIVRIGLERDFNKNILLKGRELFTWERAILCPICSHWWFSVIVGVVLLIFDGLNAREDLGLAAFYYLVNHFLIRKIS